MQNNKDKMLDKLVRFAGGIKALEEAMQETNKQFGSIDHKNLLIEITSRRRDQIRTYLQKTGNKNG